MFAFAVGMVAALLAPGADAAAADAVTLAGAPDSAYHKLLGPRLRDTLFPRFEIELRPEENQVAALNAVANDRGTMAFSQRDVFSRFVRDTPRAAKAVEFYGRMPACLYFVVRKNGLLERYADIAERQIGDGVTLDVGPASGETAASFAALAEADPVLAKVKLEHRGGMRALSRVSSGQIDGLLLVSPPGAADGLVEAAAANNTLWVLPIAERDIFRSDRAPGFPFAFRRVPVGSGGWFGFGPEVETICTEYGVVVNTAANPQLLEATAAAVMSDALSSARASVGSTLEGILRWVVDTAMLLLAHALAILSWAFDTAIGLGQAIWDMRPWGRNAAMLPDSPAVRPARLAL